MNRCSVCKSPIKFIDEVEEEIRSVCKERNWKYTPELLTDFEEYYQKYKLDDNTTTKAGLARQWTLYISDRITGEIAYNNAEYFVKRHCKEHNFKFENKMPQLYLDWYNDPKNKDKVTYVYEGGICNCIWCKERVQTLPHPTHYTMIHSHEKCVEIWFGTLKKCINW
jgi:hypothetical protein